MVKLDWLPGRVGERAGNEYGRSRARTLIGDGHVDGGSRVGHVGETMRFVKWSEDAGDMRSAWSWEVVCCRTARSGCDSTGERSRQASNSLDKPGDSFSLPEIKALVKRMSLAGCGTDALPGSR